MADYSNSLPPSLAQDVFTGNASLNGLDISEGTSLAEVFNNPAFDVDTTGAEFTGSPLRTSLAWTFICAPESISWSTANAVNRVDMFGTNNPPAVSGTRGLRELTLSNALVEGFTRNKTVEAKISALEELLEYKDSLAGGFVNVPVYQIWANQKGYGNSGYFLLKGVNVKETMRDLTGNATRASVDVTLMEVPAYQVGTGQDQAPFSQLGSGSNLTALKNKFDSNKTQAAAVAAGASTQPGKPPAVGDKVGGKTEESKIKGRANLTRIGGIPVL